MDTRRGLDVFGVEQSYGEFLNTSDLHTIVKTHVTSYICNMVA
jgi:hypothetical protein